MGATKTAGPARVVAAFIAPFAGWAEGQASSRVGAMRRAGLASFEVQGIPTSADEDWRFTPLSGLVRQPFEPWLTSPGARPDGDWLGRVVFGGLSGARLVFVDGHHVPELSTVGELPDGVRVEALSARLRQDAGELPEGMGDWVTAGDNAFAALNAAYFTDGASLEVADGVEVADPIHLVFVSSAETPGGAGHLRNRVVVGAGGRLTVIESYLSLTAVACMTNVVTELRVGVGAYLEQVKYQDENRGSMHVATVGGEFGAGSRVRLHSFSLGGRLARTNFRVRLAGEGLECVLNGLYLTHGEQVADHHMVVEHAQPNCASHEYFNGILDDRSRGVFHGRILVRPVAQKTDAKQTNKNLLLSDDARVNTKPQLEIYADDVKCTHGATIGQLDEDAVFYLRARGMGVEQARRMLIHAFAAEIIERVECPGVREELDRLIWDRLEQNPHIGVGVEGG
jgi:Fe-S cluster assembly protein SufD